ncbi:MAG: alpha/beta hydrolase [Pseudomonadota bacterium]
MGTQLFPDFHVIIVPGLHDSSPDHWQSRWQRAHPEFERVVQDDWDHPQLAAWSARLDAVRRRDPRPSLLVAHSFGCLTVAHSIARDDDNIAGVLLVAPADPDKFGVATQLPLLPFPCPSLMVSSANDPWMSATKAALWAARWRCELVEAGALGHINADSRIGDWAQGQRCLQRIADLAHNRRLAFSA